MRRHINLFLLATGVALVCRFFFIEDYRIVSDSMSPGLLSGDLVFVSKFDFNLRLPFSTYEIFRFRLPRRGEIVTFTLPDRGLQAFVKRVVAIEGDKVVLRKGVLEVNGVPAKYEAATGTVPGELSLMERWPDGLVYPIRWDQGKEKDYGPVEVPPGHFFALGDNRSSSVDSRSWGPVPLSCLKGHVAYVWLSVDSDGNLRKGRSWIPVNAYALQAASR